MSNTDVADSWEDALESETWNQRIAELRGSLRHAATLTDPSSSSHQCESFPLQADQTALMRVRCSNEDDAQSRYVVAAASATPRITILRRPASSDSVGSVQQSQQGQSSRKSGSSSSTQPSPAPLKSLQQRQAEYAEARQRIMGSCSSEPEAETPVAPVSTETGSLRLFRLNNGAGGGVIAPAVVTTVRSPRGPDGSPGFVARR